VPQLIDGPDAGADDKEDDGRNRSADDLIAVPEDEFHGEAPLRAFALHSTDRSLRLGII
jgi:hypothetical protein